MEGETFEIGREFIKKAVVSYLPCLILAEGAVVVFEAIVECITRREATRGSVHNKQPHCVWCRGDGGAVLRSHLTFETVAHNSGIAH